MIWVATSASRRYLTLDLPWRLVYSMGMYLMKLCWRKKIRVVEVVNENVLERSSRIGSILLRRKTRKPELISAIFLPVTNSLISLKQNRAKLLPTLEL